MIIDIWYDSVVARENRKHRNMRNIGNAGNYFWAGNVV